MKKTLIILSGCSGVGKNAVWKYIKENSKLNLEKVTTTTSRPIRKGETHGKEYYFISKEEFETLISNNQLIEFATIHTNYYGSTLKSLENASKKDIIPVYEVDFRGLKFFQETLKDNYEIISIFILPPSFEDLEKRLLTRGTETSEVIKIRIETAKKELEEVDIYDHRVINDNIERVGEEILDIIHSKIKNKKI
ncbi:MAG: guanylate kinase [Candidatus Gracilibacteria bacterium]|nr:guanylate kinase [Candidatus Gracilibacteria bacterium]MDD2908712.1 guanylate kinase [Candidatus Gracilibacteria bacterium]